MAVQTFKQFRESSVYWLLDHVSGIYAGEFTAFPKDHVVYDLYLSGHGFLVPLHFYKDGAHFILTLFGREFQTIQDVALFLCNNHGLRFTATLSLLNDNPTVKRVGPVKQISSSRLRELASRYSLHSDDELDALFNLHSSHKYLNGFVGFDEYRFCCWTLNLDSPAFVPPGIYFVSIENGDIWQSVGDSISPDGDPEATSFRLLDRLPSVSEKVGVQS